MTIIGQVLKPKLYCFFGNVLLYGFQSKSIIFTLYLEYVWKLIWRQLKVGPQLLSFLPPDKRNFHIHHMTSLVMLSCKGHSEDMGIITLFLDLHNWMNYVIPLCKHVQVYYWTLFIPLPRAKTCPLIWSGVIYCVTYSEISHNKVI